jgi:serine phosphatase RsbU (regulator of sigma subunit)
MDLVDKHSPVIGAFGDIDYESNEEHLDFGDIMVCYTDGIIEARCDHEFYGEERLVNFIKTLAPVPVENIPVKIYDDMMACTGTKLNDDVAVLAVSRKLEYGNGRDKWSKSRGSKALTATNPPQ